MAKLFNTDFFRNISLLLRPALLIPDVRIRSLSSLPRVLDQHAIRYVIFDLDQTIAPFGDETVDPIVLSTLHTIRAAYPCCILSNIPDSPGMKDRIDRIANSVQIPVVVSTNKKPSPCAFRAALDFLHGTPSTTAMVGDRLLTDILGAKNMGIVTVLVRPLNWHHDPFFMVTLPRLLEMVILAMLTPWFNRHKKGTT